MSKKTSSNKCWQNCGEKGNACTLLAGMRIGAATMENSTEDFQELKIELLHEPAVPILSIYQKSQTKTKEKQ